MEDFGQPRIRYTVLRDFSERQGHRHKVSFTLTDAKGNALARFNICECAWDGLCGNITKNLEKASKAEGDRRINISEKDMRYIG